MVKKQWMGDKMRKKLNLSKFNIFLEKMHDEIITRIIVENDKLSLHIDDLHFSKKYLKAELVFNSFDDIKSDVYFEFCNTNNLSITGKTVFLDDFFDNKTFSSLQFEIIDIYMCFQKICIKGAVIKNAEYVSDFNLFVNSKSLTLFFRK